MRAVLLRDEGGPATELAAAFLPDGETPEASRQQLVPALMLYLECLCGGSPPGEPLPEALEAEFARFHALHGSDALRGWFVALTAQVNAAVRSRLSAIHPLVQRVNDYVRHRYRADCSLKTLAAEFHVSPGYLGQLFRTETGVYFSEYLMAIRLQAAQQLLLKTDLRVREILYEIGISNQSYFNRAFKKAFGLSPLEYRYKSGNH